jgi:DNA-binding MarR family transcriptional regulator
VSRLEKRGWVRRAPDPDDGRYTLAILTDEGLAKVTQTAPGHVGEVRRLVFGPLNRPRSGSCGRSAAGSCAQLTQQNCATSTAGQISSKRSPPP